MTRTVFFTATTLDGYLADEHDSLDWLFVQDIDPRGANDIDAFMEGIGALVMGRTTYEWVRDHLEQTGEAWPYPMPTWVVTHADPRPIEGADLHFVAGDVGPIHAAAADAAGTKNIWLVGGGDLAAQFAEAGQLDELVVSIAPVTLGAGRPLFPRPHHFELTDVTRNRDFICATYKVVGAR